MTEKRKKFDMNRPDIQDVRHSIIQGAYLTQGTVVAFPLCFPGVTVPIPPDESRITALTLNPEGDVYGGTGGEKAHLFVGMFRGATGMVFDLGSVPDATESVAVCCGKTQVALCANGPDGGRVIARSFQRRPFDLLQEWSFQREPFQRILLPEDSGPIVHALADPANDRLYLTTQNRLFSAGFGDREFTEIARLRTRGRLWLSGDGTLYGFDAESAGLWGWDRNTETLTREVVMLPEGPWNDAPGLWASSPNGDAAYTVDGAGKIVPFRPENGFGPAVGHVELTPITSMSVTLDGRIFGSCAHGIGKLFCVQPETGITDLLGVPVSVIQRRRYGYEFADAVTGRDGQVFFGENDDLGHLWIYFPRIRGRAE